MTTTVRYYLPASGSAPTFTVAGGSGWSLGAAGQVGLNMVTAPGNTAETTRTMSESLAGNASVAMGYQYLGPELPAGKDIVAIRLMMRAANISSSNSVRLGARFAVANAGVVQQELAFGPGDSYVTTTASTTAPAKLVRQQLRPYRTVTGDRLVVEPGLFFNNTIATAVSGTLKHGDPTGSADLTQGQNTTGRAWVEVDYDEPVTYTALKFYPHTDEVPSVSPAYGTWDITAQASARMRMSTLRTSGQGRSWNNSGYFNGSNLGYQMVSPVGVLPEGELKGVARTAWLGNILQAPVWATVGKLRLLLKVVSSDGTVVRGTLCDSQSEQLTTSVESRFWVSALTPVVAQAGDRLVAEIGGVSSAAQTESPRHPYTTVAGVEQSDVPSSNGTVYSNPDALPWLELALIPPPGPTKLRLGTAQPSKFYLGGVQVPKAYLGTQQL